MSTDITYSDYWLEDIEEFNTDSSTFNDSALDLDLIRLASARRGIGNFVQILTNKNIPVYFNNKDANLTDGKVVYLSSDIIKKNDFDTAVGLSLHEGSHILLSDFELLKTMWMKIPREIYDLTEPKNISKETVIDTVKFIWNIIEDRYIDDYVYTNAPGYRGYYLALYNKYFNSSKIDDMLKSNMYREPSIDAYTSRICNFMNINTDLSALPDLRTIAQIIDIKNIKRLTKPVERFELAFEVCKIIFKNVGEDGNKLESVEATMQPSGNTSGSIQEGGESGKETDTTQDALGGVETSVSNTNDLEKPTPEHNEGNITEISATKLKQIRKAIEKQKEFLNGEISKKKVTPYQKILLDAIEKSGMTIERVGQDVSTAKGFNGMDCIVVKNLTKELVTSEEFPMATNTYNKEPYKEMIDAINKGISMGNKLGTKLLLRNENNVTKYMRKSDGKIDKRIISELGFDNERIFCNYNAEKYNEAYIHISVDSSSSMAGIKWFETISTVTAICKACSMIENIKVTVSFRTTICTRRGNNIPYVVFGYDSDKDKFSKIPNLFKYLIPAGYTPEGLAFEAIMNICKEQKKENNCYFLNFSDGEPFLPYESGDISYHYSSEMSTNHTKRQVNKIKDRGYEVLSYFINENNYNNSYGGNNDMRYTQFKTMYGNNAAYINTNNINAVAKTINNMFLKKDEKFS